MRQRNPRHFALLVLGLGALFFGALAAVAAVRRVVAMKNSDQRSALSGQPNPQSALRTPHSKLPAGLEHAHRAPHLEPLTLVLGILCAFALGFLAAVYSIGFILTTTAPAP